MLQTLQTLKVVGYRYSKNILSITILTTYVLHVSPKSKNPTFGVLIEDLKKNFNPKKKIIF